MHLGRMGCLVPVTNVFILLVTLPFAVITLVSSSGATVASKGMLGNTAGAPPTSKSDDTPSIVTLQGELTVHTMDYHNGTNRPTYTLYTGDRYVSLLMQQLGPKRMQRLQTGQTVAVQGVYKYDSKSSTGEQLPRTSVFDVQSCTVAQHPVLNKALHRHRKLEVKGAVTSLTVMVNFCGRQVGVNATTVATEYYNTTSSANLQGWFSTCSYGSVSFTPQDNVVLQDVLNLQGCGGFSSKLCDTDWILAQVESTLLNAGLLNYDRYRTLIMIFPDFSDVCGNFAGLATDNCYGTGRCRAWLMNTVSRTLVAHQFGHLMGIAHANWIRSNGSVAPEGDGSCVMGFGQACFNAPHAWQLGWQLPMQELNRTSYIMTTATASRSLNLTLPAALKTPTNFVRINTDWTPTAPVFYLQYRPSLMPYEVAFGTTANHINGVNIYNFDGSKEEGILPTRLLASLLWPGDAWYHATTGVRVVLLAVVGGSNATVMTCRVPAGGTCPDEVVTNQGNGSPATPEFYGPISFRFSPNNALGNTLRYLAGFQLDPTRWQGTDFLLRKSTTRTWHIMATSNNLCWDPSIPTIGGSVLWSVCNFDKTSPYFAQQQFRVTDGGQLIHDASGLMVAVPLAGCCNTTGEGTPARLLIAQSSSLLNFTTTFNPTPSISSAPRPRVITLSFLSAASTYLCLGDSDKRGDQLPSSLVAQSCTLDQNSGPIGFFLRPAYTNPMPNTYYLVQRGGQKCVGAGTTGGTTISLNLCAHMLGFGAVFTETWIYDSSAGTFLNQATNLFLTVAPADGAVAQMGVVSPSMITSFTVKGVDQPLPARLASPPPPSPPSPPSPSIVDGAQATSVYGATQIRSNNICLSASFRLIGAGDGGYSSIPVPVMDACLSNSTIWMLYKYSTQTSAMFKIINLSTSLCLTANTTDNSIVLAPCNNDLQLTSQFFGFAMMDGSNGAIVFPPTGRYVSLSSAGVPMLDGGGSMFSLSNTNINGAPSGGIMAVAAPNIPGFEMPKSGWLCLGISSRTPSIATFPCDGGLRTLISFPPGVSTIKFLATGTCLTAVSATELNTLGSCTLGNGNNMWSWDANTGFITCQSFPGLVITMSFSYLTGGITLQPMANTAAQMFTYFTGPIPNALAPPLLSGGAGWPTVEQGQESPTIAPAEVGSSPMVSPSPLSLLSPSPEGEVPSPSPDLVSPTPTPSPSPDLISPSPSPDLISPSPDSVSPSPSPESVSSSSSSDLVSKRSLFSCKEFSNYNFFAGFTLPTAKKENANSKDITSLATTCDARNVCYGFTTDGFLLLSVTSPQAWRPTIDNGLCSGVYLKRTNGAKIEGYTPLSACNSRKSQ